MKWLTDIFSTGGVVESIGNVVDKFVTTDEEKAKAKLELEALYQKRESEIEETIRTELSAKEKILVAELNQGDNYTKRARPTVVYFGLVVTFLNYTLIPGLASFLSIKIDPLDLPTEFWVAWGGICSSWVIGRSAEKRGTRNKLTSAITGSKSILG